MARSINPRLSQRTPPTKRPVEPRFVAPSPAKQQPPRLTPTGRGPAIAQQQARRKRQVTRTVRRFESALTRLPRPTITARPGAVLRMVGATAWHASKLISLAILLCVVAAVAYIQSDLRWFVYREHVQIEGTTYLGADQLYEAAGIDSWNIFWLRPQAVQARLMAAPYVQSATVTITLPNQVHIQVQEEQPVALWVTAEATLWLMPDGTALPVHNEQFNTLPQLVDPQREAQDVTQNSRPAVAPELLSSTLRLLQNTPDMTQLRFNRDYGLNFNLPGTLTWVYWGDGQHMDRKLAHLAAVEELIRTGEARPQVIDVRFERPYIH